MGTTERYTSIPLDIYDKLSDSNSSSLRPKIEKMEKVIEKTKLKIKLGDKK